MELPNGGKATEDTVHSQVNNLFERYLRYAFFFVAFLIHYNNYVSPSYIKYL